MTPFTTHTGTLAPLPLLNIDTDMIIPKQFLKTIQRTGLGKSLFFEMRFELDGQPVPDFVLNQPAYSKASLLIGGANFGCGSSREHAPWALADYGFRVILAPSFADIFFNNCFKNGILPIVLEQKILDTLLTLANDAPATPVTVDLPAQVITTPTGVHETFTVDAFRKHCLLHGLDDIGLTLQQEAAISAFEAAQQREQPWLWG
jgi:3-isopropylmalate/(R)-2-methylmalate dehydratase small subunit